MPKFTAPAPNGDSRKALQERAREAARPTSTGEKKRWPFTIADHDEQALAESDSRDLKAHSAEDKAQGG
jgi:hypothetical protein